MRDVIEISGFTPGPSDVINRDIEMDRLRRDVEALRSENYMLATEVLCLRRDLVGKAATEVLDRVAAAQSADPATDDLSVCLAIEVADLEADGARLRREKVEQERVIAGLNKQLTEQFDLSTKYVALSESLRREKAALVEAHEKIASECEELAATEDVPVGDRRCYRALGRIARAALRSATEKGEPT